MIEALQINPREEPPWEIIGGALTEFNTRQAGDDHGRNLCFVLETPEGEIVGGVIGATYWDWLYISLMWVREDLRGQGYGCQLLEAAEAEARQRGATHAYLDTFSFQAPSFYQKLGYQEFGRLENFPTDHTRHFLTKAL
ncbi:MAG: GNAT family N-acetyltransferase [Anaerolineaceae bacterium]|nr:GNAT family N-acetyltransferase [Anaerolineaceae bacterium]